MHKSVSLIGNKYNMLTVVGEDYNKIDNRGHRIKRWVCQCECGNTTIVVTQKLISGHTKSCGCLISEGERKIEELLKNSNIAYQKQFIFSDLLSWLGNPLRFDFALFNPDGSLWCLIEYQGVQHEKDHGRFGLSSRLYSDPQKRDYCKKHNIVLYEIWYNQSIPEEMNKILSHDNTVPSSDENFEKV